jgi:predicted S18 family serine protease
MAMTENLRKAYGRYLEGDMSSGGEVLDAVPDLLEEHDALKARVEHLEDGIETALKDSPIQRDVLEKVLRENPERGPMGLAYFRQTALTPLQERIDELLADNTRLELARRAAAAEARELREGLQVLAQGVGRDIIAKGPAHVPEKP